ncbi:hypothetical protein Val02_64790 [Virgisporangium aliadipatigenens]|uniref:Uncharacterized protein n=1 Tax=Virgisporangium aliadipatigenens TaxID=741659 RepID=A0A8J3YSG3_9ACTN|nr:hypothetical protein [Virgisporangium aliadipatigenens]GIJ49593.1 hypothetical protein Val02_64790 [Virgisporangium aliadipatigenens]
MFRKSLIILLAGVVSLALCLFLALVLEWPRIVVYTLGLAPLFVAAASFGSAGRQPPERRR